MRRFYDDEGMNFSVLLGLGFAYHGLADAGETLATIERVPEDDRDTWVREWTATADRLRGDADAAEKRGHRISARAKLLRASTYYDHASSASPGTSSDDRFTPLWEQHRDCWDRAAALLDPPVEPIEIPYEGTTLAGYFFRPDTSGTRRPTFILNNGSDGPVISQWSLGGHAAVERAGTRSPSTAPAKARPCIVRRCTSGTTGRRSSRPSWTRSRSGPTSTPTRSCCRA